MADSRTLSFEASPVWEGIRNCIIRVKPSLTETGLFPNTRLDEHGFSSIETMMLLFEIEEMFGISIIDRGMDSFQTFGALEAMVHRLARA